MTDRQTAANATTDTEDMISTNLGRTLVGTTSDFLPRNDPLCIMAFPSIHYTCGGSSSAVGDIETSTLLMVQRRLSLPVWTILVYTWSICQGCRLLSVALSVAILFVRYYTYFPLAACLSNFISRLSSTQSSTFF